MTPPRLAALAVCVVLAATLAGCADGGGGGTTASGTDATAVARGREVVTSHGCAACHSSDGSDAPGPTFRGMFGSTVDLDVGDTVTADEAYVRRAIEDPSAEVADGYAVTMPPTTLTAGQVDDVIAYLRSIGR